VRGSACEEYFQIAQLVTWSLAAEPSPRYSQQFRKDILHLVEGTHQRRYSFYRKQTLLVLS
jgi:hypothetical protein